METVPNRDSEKSSRELVISFEDLIKSGEPTGPLPEGYAGCTWSESAWFVTKAWRPSVWINGQVALLNAYGKDVTFDRDDPFDLAGLTLASLWESDVEIVLEGWERKAMKYSQTLPAFKTRGTRYQLDYRRIDRVYFGTGGVHVVVDSITLRLG